MNWDKFYPHVLPYVIGCPLPTVDHHIKQAVIEFCRRTLCYSVTLDPITGDGAATNFELDLPVKTDIVKIEGLAVNGRNCGLVDTRQGRELVRSHFRGDFAFTEDNSTINVFPAPDLGYEILVDVSLTPNQDATSIENGFIEQYIRDIAYGVLENLMLIPKTTWENIAMAQINGAKFNSAVSTVAAKISRGRSTARMRRAKKFF